MRKTIKDRKRKVYIDLRGQSLFEVVMALAIIALITAALVLLSTLSIKSASFSRDKTLATRYSQEATEWLRGERDKGWTDFYNTIHLKVLSPNSPYCMPTLTWSLTPGHCTENDKIAETALKRELEFTEISPNLIGVKVIVHWADAQGLHDSITYTDFTNWKAGQ